MIFLERIAYSVTTYIVLFASYRIFGFEIAVLTGLAMNYGVIVSGSEKEKKNKKITLNK